MSKIICDVCGTSFSDTAAQCPICGCVPSEDTRIMVGTIISTQDEREKESYTYVKGGRFSKSNVKKRSSGKSVKIKEPKPEKEKKPKPGEYKLFPKLTENRGLVIAILALLLAIVAVVMYIAFRFFIPFGEDTNKKDYPTTTQQQQQDQSNDTQNPDDQQQEEDPDDKGQEEEPVDQKIPCTALDLSVEKLDFKEEGAEHKIIVTVSPEDTTDAVTFVSSNTAVATVDGEGNVIAVSDGDTQITVSCGDISMVVPVTCKFPVEEPLPEPNTYGQELLKTGGFKFNLSSGAIAEFSLRPGGSHTLSLTSDGQSGNVITKITPAETTHYSIDGTTKLPRIRFLRQRRSI